ARTPAPAPGCPRRSALPGRPSYALAPLQPLLSLPVSISKRRTGRRRQCLSAASGDQALAVRPPPSVAPCHYVEGFHRARKEHGKIDVAARNMELEAIGNQRN